MVRKARQKTQVMCNIPLLDIPLGHIGEIRMGTTGEKERNIVACHATKS